MKAVVQAIGPIIVLWLSTPGCGLAQTPLFIDQAVVAGIEFTHFNGMSGNTYFPEIVGAGVALLDYDRDGDLDVYLVQGDLLGPEQSFSSALIAPRHPLPLTDRLYRNDSTASGGLHFTDVTQQAELPAGGYGIGVSVGDINNDGWPDLYLSNFGSNRLLLNRGDGRFEDITASAGVDDPRWSITAVFLDFDRDGWLDLYLVNYVNYSFANIKTCRSHHDSDDYCSPQSFLPVADRLFHNLGNGKFEDVTAKSGIGRVEGPGLGAVAGDFNGDGWVDLYVANDGAANFLWINQKNGRFQDQALLAGVAVNMEGIAEASMGVDAADFDADGDLDLFMTHLARQTNTLYVNDGNGWFIEQTGKFGLASSSFAFTGFGARWFDFNNDGWLDLLSANGAVMKIEQQQLAGEVFPLQQTNQLWKNLGNGQYQDVSQQAGPAFARSLVSRGAAFGDLDNDGDTDVLISNCAGPAQLLINQNDHKNAWIGLEILEQDGRPSATGATVRVSFGERQLLRRSRTDGSYASAHDPRILVGLGEWSKPVSVQVVWPGGEQRTLVDLASGRYHQIRKPATGTR